MWHFIFVDQSGGQEAEEAALLLADGLSRQGYQPKVTGEWLSVEGPGEEEQWLYLLTEEALLNSPVLRAFMNEKALLLISSTKSPEALQERLPAQAAAFALLPTKRIALAEGAEPVSALLGGVARLAPWIDPDRLGEALWAHYDCPYSLTARAATRAMRVGYQQAKQRARSAPPLR